MGFGDLGQAILALVFVLGLIGVLAMIARRFGLGGINSMPQMGQQKRLGVVEVKSLDARRRLVLIRRDDVEHLIIAGPDGETVIERGIPAKSAVEKAETIQPLPSPRLAAGRESDT